MIKKAGLKIKKEQELGARRAVLEDLFYDFHSSRRQVYWFNFWRGIFFGIGSIVGGTLVVALILWLLNLLVDIPGGVGDFVQYIVNTVQQKN
ncbi:MAG: DUF5665 domain-containing protein [Candidatus Saccharimonadales bacterium]